MAKKIRILLANSSEDSLVSLRKLLESAREIRITGEARDGKETFEMALEFQPDIIIMAANLPFMDGYETCMKVAKVAPYIGVILVGPSESIQVIRQAMRSGAGDFLELPVSSSQLREAVVALYNVKQLQKKHLIDNPLAIPRREPKVITIFSSKGGVGKTVLATNIAIALKQLTREDVLLIDLDLQFGDVADLLNLTPKTGIVDLLADKSKIETNEFVRYLIPHECGVNVLAAPQHPEQADLVSGSDVKELTVVFKTAFDYIVIDLPPLFNEVTLGAIEEADHLLLVATMEIPTLKNIKGGLDILRRLECPEDKIMLVLNRFDTRREINAGDILKFLDMKEMSCIDDNPELVSTSINLGEPVVLRNKESAVAKQITTLAKSMVDYTRISPRQSKESLAKRLKAKGLGLIDRRAK